MSAQTGAASHPPIVPMMDGEALAAFLRSRRPHPPAIGASGLDGYLTALIIGPRFIDPRQWIPLFVGDKALMAPEGTPEFSAVQTIVANYNRISACLADFPGAFRPKFDDRGNGVWDSIFWTGGFLSATEHAPRLWRPVIRGHSSTGDIIAPIRALSSSSKTIAGDAEMRAVAKAAVDIREYFMPRRVKDARRR